MNIYEKDDEYRAFNGNDIVPSEWQRVVEMPHGAKFTNQLFACLNKTECRMACADDVYVGTDKWKPAPFGTQAVWWNPDNQVFLFYRIKDGSLEYFNEVKKRWVWACCNASDLGKGDFNHLQHMWGTLPDYSFYDLGVFA